VSTPLRFGRFELRPAERLLLDDGKPAALGVRALDVLIALAQRRDQVVGQDELIDLAWPGLVVEPNNLQVQISALRKLLGAEAIATVKRRGYQFTAALREAGTENAAAQPEPAPTPNRLPLPRTRFIGREHALADCAGLLERAPLLTLTGTGGSGKTRLAIELAQRQLASFAAGAWFVDLAALQDPRRLLAAVASAAGARQDSTTDPLDALCAHIGTTRALLVLDNCEHLIDPVAQLADRLLAACPGLRILATSREALGVPGEQIFAVGPLPIDSDAVRLFVDRARLARPDFALTPANEPVIAEICRRLDGIALAIELAAARVRMFAVDEIRSRLDDRFRFLTGSSHAAPRHRTLSATLQWSVKLLSEPEAQVFARLSVFVGGCTLAAAAVAAGIDDEYAVLQIVTQLHDKSLLVMAPENLPEPRFRMLETVRQFAQDLLDDTGEAPAVRARCLAHFVAFAEAAGGHLHGPGELAWLRRLKAEQDNLIAAHDWCAELPEGTRAGWRFVAALGRYWAFAGPLDVGYCLGTAALARDARGLDDALRGKALLAMSHLAYKRGFYDEALRWADQGGELAASADDAERTAVALSLRANAWHALGRADEALSAYEQATELLRSNGVPDIRLVVSLNNIAEIHRGVCRHAQARALYDEAIALAKRLELPASVTGQLQGNLAQVQVTLGQWPAARETLRALWPLVVRDGLPKMGARLAEVAAGLASALGEHAHAARLHGVALAGRREDGERADPVDEAFIAPLMAASRGALGVERFEAERAAGEAMTQREVEGFLTGWLATPRS
jgi:predicted ATPase/DNA-binding winged helix-turn-helix (wHTH) protein